MNRPRNRQPRAPRQSDNRGPPRQFRAPGTPQQAAGTVPKTYQVIPGASVFIILKEDQPTGEETQGTVQDVLTRGNHPRGIKVRLQDGQVGRVQRMGTGVAPTGSGQVGGQAGSAASSRFTMRYSDVRNDEYSEPPPRSLADFMPDFPEPEREVATAVTAGADAVKCPFCDEFEGDEVAVTHHIDQRHLS
ncbi:Fc.00g078300.m01.CDS01 [Cosmosporella sp. VM-42]